jgi:hypothetical protein
VKRNTGTARDLLEPRIAKGTCTSIDPTVSAVCFRDDPRRRC